LPPPVWFANELLLFRDAVEKVAVGDRTTAIQILRTIRSDEMRLWFDEHGQMSGKHRARRFGIVPTVVPPDQFDLVRSPARFEKAVFKRDSYTCCYCGLKLVAKQVLVVA
jgi:hypothetical protein